MVTTSNIGYKSERDRNLADRGTPKPKNKDKEDDVKKSPNYNYCKSHHISEPGYGIGDVIRRYDKGGGKSSAVKKALKKYGKIKGLEGYNLSVDDEILPRKIGEAQKSYRSRLNTFGASIIGTIENYEKIAKLQRQRALLPITKSLYQNEDNLSEVQAKELIKKFMNELLWYEENYGEFADDFINKRLKNLKSLLS